LRLFVLALLLAPCAAHAQGGPPFLTNDPGTPGDGHWEINVAAAQTLAHGIDSYQLPQFDLNYGVGERVQLTYEVPYVVETMAGAPRHSGWSNAYPGVKWRFLDQGEDGWQLSTFPQVETGAGVLAQQRGIASPGSRFLLPFEAARKVGPIDLDVEAGYYFPKRGLKERIIGLVAGHSFSEGLELDAELYDDRASGDDGAVGGAPRYTLLDLGGRYKLTRGINALFMAGRSVTGTGGAGPTFNGYFGIQILLQDYGRSLASE
jgi:hypothetical protein